MKQDHLEHLEEARKRKAELAAACPKCPKCGNQTEQNTPERKKGYYWCRVCDQYPTTPFDWP
jgi:hypothetical protein